MTPAVLSRLWLRSHRSVPPPPVTHQLNGLCLPTSSFCFMERQKPQQTTTATNESLLQSHKERKMFSDEVLFSCSWNDSVKIVLLQFCVVQFEDFKEERETQLNITLTLPLCPLLRQHFDSVPFLSRSHQWTTVACAPNLWHLVHHLLHWSF